MIDIERKIWENHIERTGLGERIEMIRTTLERATMREPAEGPYGPNQLWALTRLRPLFMRIACSAPALESSRETKDMILSNIILIPD